MAAKLSNERSDRQTIIGKIVERVSWYDAIEFCARLSRLTGREYRLPSEAEWEYACHAPSPLASLSKEENYPPFHFGETITTDLANYKGHFLFANESKGQYRQGTTPVDEFIYPNAFGLYDLHGNVLEWCLDSWHDNYEGAPNNGEVWDRSLRRSLRACARGGYWYFCPNACRSSKRFSLLKDTDRGVIPAFDLKLPSSLTTANYPLNCELLSTLRSHHASAFLTECDRDRSPLINGTSDR
ncbi:MAG: formylglycine-generating enzyme family protein [Cyanobacteria bacterium SBLK]|nr:formylglycine-generating enzyme family protein [Cyanobacteria bacterium SBLK]